MQDIWQDRNATDWKQMGKYTSFDRLQHDEIYILLKIFNEMFPSKESQFSKFIDCGPGFAGSEAWSINDFYPECEIIGIEPQVERFSRLRDAMYPGSLINACVCSQNGEIDAFTGHKDGASDFRLKVSNTHITDNRYQECKTPAITIDSLITSDDTSVFVWADIEGAEYEMLLGCKESLEKNKILAFFLEIHKEQSGDGNIEGNGTFDDILVFLRQYGFAGVEFSGGSTVSSWLFFRPGSEEATFEPKDVYGNLATVWR